MKTVICPMPSLWAEIHRRILDEAAGDPTIPTPPVPLNLAGWAYSSDREKKDRWQATLDWAERYGLRSLVDELPKDSMYMADDVDGSSPSSMGGTMFLRWNFEAKPKICVEEAERALAVLRAGWNQIVGPEIASLTLPLRLTGAKKRRLLVRAKVESMAPWGSWTALIDGEGRKCFTRFRVAINEAIKPLEVDHIDFTSDIEEKSEWKR